MRAGVRDQHEPAVSVQAAVQRAEALAQEGERLISMKHYAVDSILPKCQELRAGCDHCQAELGHRQALLGQSLELHGLLEAVGRSCPGHSPLTLTGPRSPPPSHPIPPPPLCTWPVACTLTGPDTSVCFHLPAAFGPTSPKGSPRPHPPGLFSSHGCPQTLQWALTAPSTLLSVYEVV